MSILGKETDVCAIRMRMAMMIYLVTILVLTQGKVATGEEFKVDGHTTLLCHFNDNLNDEAGGVKVILQWGDSPTFVPGKFDKGISLGKTYLSLESWQTFNQKEGTIEMWGKPHWDVGGVPRKYHYLGFFICEPYWLDCVLSPSDSSPMGMGWFSDGRGGPSYLTHESTDWPSDEWRYLAATWKDGGEGNSILEFYINGKLIRKSDKATIPEPDKTIRIGHISRAPEIEAKDHKLEVVFDELRISNIRRTAAEIEKSYGIGSGIKIESLKE